MHDLNLYIIVYHLVLEFKNIIVNTVGALPVNGHLEVSVFLCTVVTWANISVVKQRINLRYC